MFKKSKIVNRKIEQQLQFQAEPHRCVLDLRVAFRILGVLCFLLTGTARVCATAVSITLDPNFPGDYLLYTYTDALGNSYTDPVGPYPATLVGGSYVANQTYFVWCLDINVDTSAGVSYPGSVITPTTPVEIEMAYLEDQAFQLGGYGAAVATIGPYGMAIWQLMNPSSINPGPFPLDPAAQSLVTQAQTIYSNGTWTQADAAQYAIWVPDNLSSSQRFGLIAANGTTGNVPEPASFTFTLMGAGLLIVYAALRRAMRMAPGKEHKTPRWRTPGWLETTESRSLAGKSVGIAGRASRTWITPASFSRFEPPRPRQRMTAGSSHSHRDISGR